MMSDKKLPKWGEKMLESEYQLKCCDLDEDLIFVWSMFVGTFLITLFTSLLIEGFVKLIFLGVSPDAKADPFMFSGIGLGIISGISIPWAILMIKVSKKRVAAIRRREQEMEEK